jgi:hypothetical protein
MSAKLTYRTFRRPTPCVYLARILFMGTLGGLLLNTSCQSLHIGSANKEKVNSARFEARNSAYFPSYLLSVFSGAELFNKKHSRLEAAREGVQFVQEIEIESNSDMGSPFKILDWSQDGFSISYKKSTGSQATVYIRNLENLHDVKVLWPSSIDSESVLGYCKKNSKILKIQGGVLQSSEREFFARGLGHFWNPVVHNNGWDLLVPSKEGDIGIYDLMQREFKAKLRYFKDVCQPQWSMGKSFVFSATEGLRTSVYFAHVTSNSSYSIQAMSDSVFRTECPVVSEGSWMLAFSSPSQNKKFSDLYDLHVVANPLATKLTGEQIQESVVALNIDRKVAPVFTIDARRILYSKRLADGKEYIEVYDLISGERYRYNRAYENISGMKLSKDGVLAVSYSENKLQYLAILLTNQSEFLQGRSFRSFIPFYAKEGI